MATRFVRFALVAIAAFAAVAAPSLARALDPAEVPPALRDWIPWVTAPESVRACPLIDGVDSADDAARACRWPGALSLEVAADGATFTQRWQVFAATTIELPGDAMTWPLEVRANGVPVAVVANGAGMPVIHVDRGEFAIDGRFGWTRRPDRLAVPAAVGLVGLRVDGEAIAPLERDGDFLLLGQALLPPREADSVELVVHRLLGDGIPQRLLTRIEFRVAGEPRERAFGAVLPDGFVPVALASALAARIDPNRGLVVQLRPGVHAVEIEARATAIGAVFKRPRVDAPWPEQEIWSYTPDPSIRSSEAGGAPTADPAQSGVPAAWAANAAFVLDADSTLAITERGRGLSDQEQNRLNLDRDLWLAFDGEGFAFRDRVYGSMMRDYRLDVRAPYRLTRAEQSGAPLLVTRGVEDGESGVEVRERELNLSAAGRIDARGALPASGWSLPLERIDARLMLPPGHGLIAAIGADGADSAWVARWTLLDVFAVAFVTLLGFWYGRVALALPLAALLVLAWFEIDFITVWLVLITLSLLLARRSLPDGALARWLSRMRWVALVLLVLSVLPFAAGQLRAALYPQLERTAVMPYAIEELRMAEPSAASQEVTMADEMLQSPAAPAAMSEADAANKSLAVQGSQDRASEPLGSSVGRRYAPDVRLQAGGGDPAWSWSTHRLSFQGPVLAEQSLNLVISPPWLTRTGRVFAVVLLALVLAALAGFDWRTRRLRAIGAGALLAAALVLPSAAMAQATPAPEILKELSERAGRVPACAPNCAALATVRVEADGDRVRYAATFNVAARVAVPLPLGDAVVTPTAVRVDGVDAVPVLRRVDGVTLVLLERGVRRVDVELDVTGADAVALDFALAPRFVELALGGWTTGSLRDARLIGDRLALARTPVDGAVETSTPGAAAQFAPFVRVTRALAFDTDFSVTTRVERIAPVSAAFAVVVPLIDGERLTDAALVAGDSGVTVAFAAGQNEIRYASALDRRDRYALTAPALSDRAEIWIVSASPMFNVVASGVPLAASAPPEMLGRYHPLPGETLAVAVARPEAVPGGTLAIEAVNVTHGVGARASESVLTLTLRATAPTPLVLTLPAGGELTSVSIDNDSVNARIEDGALRVMVPARATNLVMRWRTMQEIGFVSRTPSIALDAPAANIALAQNLPADRWVLATTGPALGPAVLYWPALALLVLLAWGISRSRRTPLKFRDWLLLALGFSTFSWTALFLVALWLFALDARARWRDAASSRWFNVAQVGLALLSAIALLALVSTIPQGLLGTPDMQVTGYGSTATELRWFADASAAALPVASAFSVSMWWYKALMLAWALWLANALLGWLRYGWQAWTEGGYWQNAAPRNAGFDDITTPAPPPPRPERPDA